VSGVHEQMRADWNARAREDAGYYVAFGARNQDPEEFFATAAEVVKGLEWEMRRLPPAADPRTRRALEIGCGPGRLLRPLSRHFGEIHGVDVSDEMVARARANLAHIPHAHAHTGSGSSLALFASESFDFVYSYAVFQHIPSRDVVLDYLREARRVMKPGAVLRAQFNGLPPAAGYDTWSGVRFTADELLAFAREHDFQVLTLEGRQTQYLWSTWIKRPAGWAAALAARECAARIRAVTNAENSEPVAPRRGRYAAISAWVEHLPDDATLHALEARIGGAPGVLTYIGPADAGGLRQVNVLLPELDATGLLPVELFWLGRRISNAAILRVIPPGPAVPLVLSVTDGVNLVAHARVETRSLKVVIEELDRPDAFAASVGGLPVEEIEFFCTDPRPRRFEVNMKLPAALAPGCHALEMRIGRRRLAPVPLEVVRNPGPAANTQPEPPPAAGG
jgi:SAM-dependent methyltransferase